MRARTGRVLCLRSDPGQVGGRESNLSVSLTLGRRRKPPAYFLESDCLEYIGSMWWFVFTAVDLYIGVVALDLLARSGSISPEKLPRLAVARKVTFLSLAVVVVALLVKL